MSVTDGGNQREPRLWREPARRDAGLSEDSRCASKSTTGASLWSFCHAGRDGSKRDPDSPLAFPSVEHRMPAEAGAA